MRKIFWQQKKTRYSKGPRTSQVKKSMSLLVIRTHRRRERVKSKTFQTGIKDTIRAKKGDRTIPREEAGITKSKINEKKKAGRQPRKRGGGDSLGSISKNEIPRGFSGWNEGLKMLGAGVSKRKEPTNRRGGFQTIPADKGERLTSKSRCTKGNRLGMRYVDKPSHSTWGRGGGGTEIARRAKRVRGGEVRMHLEKQIKKIR